MLILSSFIICSVFLTWLHLFFFFFGTVTVLIHNKVTVFIQCSASFACQPGQKVCVCAVSLCVSMHVTVCLSLICRMSRCVDDSIPPKKGWARDGDGEDSRWLAALPRGGWWRDEGASRKDILSCLVRVWPVLHLMSLVARITNKHIFLTPSHITLPLRSPSVSH